MTDDLSPSAVAAAMLKARRSSLRVSWVEVARLLAEHGVMGRDGQPLKPNAVRMAFGRLQKVAAPKRKPEPPPVVVERTEPVAAPPAAREAASAEEDPVARLMAQWAAEKMPMPRPIR